MNNDKLREVARAIELEPAAFRMDVWLEPDNTMLCGSVGCIAGTTVWTDEAWKQEHRVVVEEGGEEFFENIYDDEVSEYASALLDLPFMWGESDHTWPLFTSGKWWYRACKHLDLPLPDLSRPGRYEIDGMISWITAKHAATVLYALADGTITIEQFCDV